MEYPPPSLGSGDGEVGSGEGWLHLRFTLLDNGEQEGRRRNVAILYCTVDKVIFINGANSLEYLQDDAVLFHYFRAYIPHFTG